MGTNSRIEWTDHTFNPWIGCTKVSDGCKHCYAETLMDKRWKRVEWGPSGKRKVTTTWQEPLKWHNQSLVDGDRKRVFCASLADVFEDNPQLVMWREDLFKLIGDCFALDWLILTKRPENIGQMVPDRWRTHWPEHVMTGASPCDQKTANQYIRDLIVQPGDHFLSIEPMLGPVDLDEACPEWWQTWAIKWVIVGGESGAGARPMNEDWVRKIRDQCHESGVPFFYKQRIDAGKKVSLPILDGEQFAELPR